MSRIVALTGGTGFIGHALWKSLESRGWTVRRLIRPSFVQAHPERLGTEYIKGTLGDEESLHALVAGVDAVVHCAGTVRGVDPTHFYEANVEGVSRLTRITAEKCPQARFLLISSLAAGNQVCRRTR